MWDVRLEVWKWGWRGGEGAKAKRAPSERAIDKAIDTWQGGRERAESESRAARRAKGRAALRAGALGGGALGGSRGSEGKH